MLTADRSREASCTLNRREGALHKHGLQRHRTRLFTQAPLGLEGKHQCPTAEDSLVIAHAIFATLVALQSFLADGMMR